MRRRTLRRAIGVFLTVTALTAVPLVAAQAYSPSGSTIVQLSADEPCLKGRGNCIIYPKSAQLPSGRIVMGFEKSTVVPASGSADGQTIPIYKSDDDGATWQHLSEVKAPAYLSDDPQYAKYVSNWTNPFLYVLPESVGNLAAGTLLLTSIVSGDDEYYKEHKAADPNWVPSNDGDRSDLAVALFSSTDEGATWNLVNVVATGGWQGGSAGATGTNVAAANPTAQVDPLWEPFLLVVDGTLICFYSDENDYLGYDPTTGVAIMDPDNDTAPDSHGQILAHKTWDGLSATWGDTILDVAGTNDDMGGGKVEIGGGRPGMTTVVPTADGKWMLTFEFEGGNRYKLADDPEKFFADGDPDGTPTSTLPLDAGSRAMSGFGSPVLTKLPDGRILYNYGGSGNVWVNESGRSDGVWTEFQSPLGSGYSRPLQYVQDTGRVMIFRAVWGDSRAQASITRADVDLGNSKGTYYQLVNRKTGEVMGTGDNTNDANIGNGDAPDVVSEPVGAAANPATQYWHTEVKSDGKTALLNKSGGREAAIWTGRATAGQKLGQWVDNSATGRWTVIDTGDGYVRFQSVANTGLYVSGATAGAAITLQPAATDGSQDWKLVEADPNSQTIQVTVPTVGDGEFSWRIDGSNDLVDMGAAVNEGDHFAAEGSINPIRVTDTRRGGPVWSASAQVSDFTSGAGSFSGKYLGWTPTVLEAGGGATAGVHVGSGFDGGDGLSVSQTLGSAPSGHLPGSARLGADLELKLPIDVTDGTYQATLTLTALS